MNLSTVIIVIAFVTSILIISSSQISFAKKNDKKEDDDEENLTEVQNDTLNDHYPNQYYFCGYHQQLITDYNFLKKFNYK